MLVAIPGQDRAGEETAGELTLKQQLGHGTK